MGRKEFNEKLEELSFKKNEMIKEFGTLRLKDREKLKFLNQINAEIVHLKLLQ